MFLAASTLIVLLLLVSGGHGFASVQSAWGACHALSLSSPSHCLCDPANFAQHLPFSLLADASMLQVYTGRRECNINMTWFHGSPDENFLSFVGWLYLYGQVGWRERLRIDEISDFFF